MQHPNDPLHGITLEALLNALVARYGWAELAKRININCFKSEPSIKSSLKFLRRTPWAQERKRRRIIRGHTGRKSRARSG